MQRSKLIFKWLAVYVLKYITEVHSVVSLLPSHVCREQCKNYHQYICKRNSNALRSLASYVTVFLP